MRFTHGGYAAGGQLALVLLEGAMTCAMVENYGMASRPRALVIHDVGLPLGDCTGDTVVASSGHPFAVPADILERSPSQPQAPLFSIDERYVRVSLTTRDAGGVRVQLSIDHPGGHGTPPIHGGGSLDLVGNCAGAYAEDARPRALPAEVPDVPIHAMIDGARRTLSAQGSVVERDGEAFLDSLRLFEGAAPPCDDYFTDPMVSLHRIGGAANTARPLRQIPQPLRTVWRGEAGRAPVTMHGYIVWSELRLAEGGVARGHLRLAETKRLPYGEEPHRTVAGTFDAVLCKSSL